MDFYENIFLRFGIPSRPRRVSRDSIHLLSESRLNFQYILRASYRAVRSVDGDWKWNEHETNEYIKEKCHNLKS